MFAAPLRRSDQAARRVLVLTVAEPRARSWRRRSSFWSGVDHLLRNDMMSQRLASRILGRQRDLSREANARIWSLYLEIEELQLRRSLRWIEIVVPWAERRGARARRRRKRGSGS